MTEKEELIDKSKKIVMSAFDNEPIYMYEEPTPEKIKDIIIEVDGRYVKKELKKILLLLIIITQKKCS